MVGSDANLPAEEFVSARGLSAAAFATQFQSSFRVLWGIAAGIVGDRVMAEDVVQEAAVVALGKLHQFREGSDFTAWMGQTVRYVALNKARKEQKRRPTGVDPDTVEDKYSTEFGLAAGDYDRSHRAGGGAIDERADAGLRRALEEVSDTARACLLLRTLEGMSYSAIARLLGIPEGTAMSHVHRTRVFLRRRLVHLSPEASTGPRRET